MTNIQVAGVDESDIVKTDGSSIYSYSETTHQIRIVRMSDMKLQKILTLPDSLSSIEMYLLSGKLVLVGHKYASVSPYSLYRYYTPESRTVVAIYNITSPENPKLERYNQVDGDYRDSRLIGSTLYFLSTSTLRIPPMYLSKNTESTAEFQKVISEVDKNFALKYVVPQIREARSTTRI